MKNKEKKIKTYLNQSTIKVGAGYVKELLTSGPDGVVGKGLELGVGAALAKTVLRRLPVPLNFIAPFLAEKVIMKHGVENGRELLLHGLRWVKKATDETPDPDLHTAQL
jgi:hypothetical protein